MATAMAGVLVDGGAVAGALGSLAVLLPMAIMLGVLVLVDRPRPALTWASIHLGISFGRNALGLVLAAGVFMAVRPAWSAFWAAFLVGSFGAIIVETWIVMAAMRALAAPTLPGAAPGPIAEVSRA